jgi:WD40 repeat protein/energy-coupling factor transporter ATP-binding protein EcfA2
MNQEATSHPSQSQINTLSNVSVGKDFIFQPTQIMYVSVDEIKTRELKPISPYKGLKKFTKDDKQYFFGRDQLILSLMQDLNQSNLILLLGASGSGKSSVVLAGLIPRLQENWGANFAEVIFKPDHDPFLSLFSGLLVKGFNQAEVSLVLSGEVGSLNNIVTTLRRDGSRWLIYIDQFEELFTISDPVKRDSFIASLVQLYQSLETAKENSVKIVMTMRADFLDRFSHYPELGSIVQGNMRLITDMHRDELWLAIEQPAAQQGVVFEEGLIEEIIKDFQGQAGTLPLLQYTLDLLWKNDNIADQNDPTKPHPSTDRTLNKSTYRNLGGVRKALETHVTEVFEDFNLEEKKAARQIFLSLVDVTASTGIDVGIKAVSRRANRSKFVGDLVNAVLFRLIDENLLISNKTSDQEATVEVAHEALLSSWDKLKEWINEAHQVIAIKNRIEQSAKQRREALRNSPEAEVNDEYCLRGSQLETALEQRSNGTFDLFFGGLSQEENEFIDVSLEWRDRLLREREEQIRQLDRALTESTLREQATRVLNWLPIRPLDALVLAIQTMGLNLDQFPPEVLHSPKALAKFPGTLLNSVQASLQQVMENVRVSLPHTFQEHEATVNSFVFLSSDGKIYSGCWDSTMRLWDLSGNPIGQPFQWSEDVRVSVISSVAFSSDGKMIAVGSGNTMSLWDLSGNPIGQPFQHGDDIANYDIVSVAFSPDGKTIVTGSHDKTVRLWDLNGNPIGQPFQGHEDAVTSVAFSPDGKTIVTGSHDKTVRLWDLNGNPIGQPFQGHEDAVTSVAFSSDGKMIASGDSSVWGGSDRTTRHLRVWDLSGNPIGQPFRHEADIPSVAFSPDGKTIISGSEESIVTGSSETGDNGYKTIIHLHLWDVSGNPIGQPFQGHEDRVTSVAFSPDGKMIASGSHDKTVRLWDASSNSTGQLLQGPDSTVSSIAFSPDGKMIASGSDYTIHLWKVDGDTIEPFQGHEGMVTSVAFSPDSRMIASGSYDKTIRLWSINNRPSSRSREQWVAAFRGHEHWVTSIAFSPDGKTIVSGSHDKTVRLWDLNGNPIGQPFQGHEDVVTSVAFSPDGKTIASGSSDKTVRLWDLNGNPIGQPFQGHEDIVTSVAFSLDGKTIVSGSHDKTVRLWRGGGRAWLEVCCDRLQRHFVFKNPAKGSMAEAACQACQKHVWNPRATELTQEGITKIQAQDFSAAIELFGQAINLNPNHINAYFHRGLVHAKSKAYQNAINDFNKVIDARPTDASAYQNRGFCYAQLGNRRSAVSDLQKAIELHQRQGRKAESEKVLNYLKQFQS